MSQQKSTLYRYAELLASCTRARLVGTRGTDDIFTLQVMDCVPSVEFLPASGEVVDVGSGGGLPGIVWAVYRPDLNITLIDSISKKCEAVNEIINALELPNVKVICSRSEEFAKTHREYFSLAGAKALASAGVCAELLSPLVKVGGKIITFKGEKVYDEIAEVNHKWKRVGLGEPELHFYGVDNSSKCIVSWEKISPCPKNYPKNPGNAKKFWEA